MEVVEQNVSNDTSTGYEDYTLNASEDTIDNEWPVCKKRKIDAQEKVIQENIIQEKPMLMQNNGHERSPHKQQNIDPIGDQQHYRNALVLTTHIQPPNLSDSDSNDTFPAITLSDKMLA